ncbi:hypothetical protein K9L97_03995 [Candidatus Woesearchaeota archaeon]|nr:hypothetical protein [Candidatus Woesearchaeota archaeon]
MKNKTTKIIIFISILMLLMNTATAIEISEFKLTWAGESIEYVSPDNRIPADIEFDYKTTENESTITKITLDATDINNDIRINTEYKELEINLEDCQENNETSTKHCKIPSLQIRITDIEIIIPATITYENGTTQTVSMETTLIIDNTKPTITKFAPTTCEESTCYVVPGKPNEIIIQMQDSIGTFNRKRIAFQLGKEQGLITECKDSTCKGFITPQCEHGQLQELKIIDYRGSPSQDDAGNPLKGQLTNNVICDNQIPQIQGINIRSGTGLDVITVNDNFVLEINITETITNTINLTINADSINAGNITQTCPKIGDMHQCILTITSQTETSGLHNLNITVTDAAGNKQKTTTPIQLHTPTETKNVDLWLLSRVEQSNKKFLRQNLRFARTIYTEITLTNDNNAKIVQAIAPSQICTPKRENRTGNKGDLRGFTIMHTDPENNKIYAQATLTQTELGENDKYQDYRELSYLCPIQLNSKQGDNYYTQPENETIEIRIRLDDGNSMYDEYMHKMEQSKKEVEAIDKKNLGLKNLVDSVQMYCRIYSLIQQGNGVIASVEAVTGSILGMQGAAEGMKQSSNSLNAIVNEAPGGKIFDKICGLATCDGEWNQLATGPFDDMMGSFGESFATYTGGTGSISDGLDPWKSRFVAVATLCLPAWIYHNEVEKSIECEFLNCLDESTQYSGATISLCQKNKDYALCVKQGENILNAIPFVANLKNMAGIISQTIADPASAIAGIAMPLACEFLPVPGHGVCQAEVAIAQAFQFIEKVNNIQMRSADIDEGECTVAKARYGAKYLNYTNPPKSSLSEPLGEDLGRSEDGSYMLKDSDIKIIPLDNNEDGRPDEMAYYKGTELLSVHTVSDIIGDKNGLGEDFQILNELSGTYNQLQNNPLSKLYLQNIKSSGSSGSTLIDYTNFKINLGDLAAQQYDLQPVEANQINLPEISDPTTDQLKEYANIVNLQYDENDPSSVIGIKTKFKHDLQIQRDALTQVSQNVQKQMATVANKYPVLGEFELMKKVDGKLMFTDPKTSKYGTIMNEISDHYDTLFHDAGPALKTQIEESRLAYKKLVDTTTKYRDDEPYQNNKEVSTAYDELMSLGYADEPYNSLSDDQQKRIKGLLEKAFGDNTADRLTIGRSLSKSVVDQIENDETLQLKVDEAKKGYETAQEEINEAAEEVQESVEAEYLAEEHDKNFGDMQRTIRTIYGISAGIRSFKSIMGINYDPETDWGSWQFMADTSRWLNEMSTIERKMCMDELELDTQTGDETVINELAPGQFSPGAIITGTRTKVDRFNETYYEYYVGGSMMQKKHESVSVNIKLKDGSKIKDITREASNDVPIRLRNGKPMQFGGVSSIIIQSEEKYSKVCLEFDKSLKTIFDYSTSSAQAICQVFIEE